MNASKTLIKLLLLSVATCLGCGSPTDSDSEPTESSATLTPADSQPAGKQPTDSEPEPAPRMLPTQEASDQSDSMAEQPADDTGEENSEDPSQETDEETDAAEEPELPSEIAAKAFAVPVGAKSISDRNVWVDRKAGRIYADGYIAMNDGPLEMFACPAGTKEHESVVATLGKASEIHAGLLALGAQVGTPVTYNPSFIPATGQRIRVWICYFDQDGKYQVTDARRWVVKSGTEETLSEDWVFAGSYIWTDPVDNQNYYQGDVGDMICVSNFTTAMLDIPVASSADTDQLEYGPNTPSIPERGTSVRMILEPIPLPADREEKPAAPKPPTADVLMKRQ